MVKKKPREKTYADYIKKLWEDAGNEKLTLDLQHCAVVVVALKKNESVSRLPVACMLLARERGPRPRCTQKSCVHPPNIHMGIHNNHKIGSKPVSLLLFSSGHIAV